MARTSKTVIGKGSGAMSDRMMRAEETGQRRVMAERERGDRINREGKQDMRQLTQGFVSSIAAKEQSDQRADQFSSSQAQQASQFDRSQANAEARTDLAGREAGFERGPGGGRAAQLEQEMQRGGQQMAGGPGAQGATGGRGPGELNSEDQARLQGQVSQPMELDGQWRSTGERDQQMADKKKGDAFKADTQRINAETARFNAEMRADEAGAKYQQAGMKGENETQQEIAAILAKPINQNVAKFDRFQNQEGSDQDWGDLSSMVGESNEFNAELKADIDAKSYTPRVQQFMRAQISKESLKFIVRTGATSNLEIDWTAPQMRQFTEQVAQVNAMAKTMGPEFAQMAGIHSVKDKMAFVQTQAAMMVLSGMDQYRQADTDGNGFVMGDEVAGLNMSGQSQQEDPTGGAPPSMGQQPEPGMEQQQGIDPNAVSSQDRTGTRHRVTSDEETQQAIADRKAGKHTPPADQRQRPTRGRTTPLTGGYH
tara:strand:- start:6555 stop:8003 length:1449 start_codon:yes stop_codon:yes gene_type:complete